MKATLYHASQDIFRDSLFFREDGTIFNEVRAMAEFNGGNYEEVAAFEFPYDETSDAITTAMLDIVYATTQNVDSAWRIENPTRSTSVGDVIKVGDEIFIVASCGFVKLDQ